MTVPYFRLFVLNGFSYFIKNTKHSTNESLEGETYQVYQKEVCGKEIRHTLWPFSETQILAKALLQLEQNIS